jgi:hypothetical protein
MIKICPYCNNTGKVVIDYIDKGEMLQREEKCECATNPNFFEELEEQANRIDYENRIDSGLILAGTTKDGEEQWMGTEEQWKEYNNKINE